MKTTAWKCALAAALLLPCLSSAASATDLTFFIGGAIPGKLSSDIVTSPTSTVRDLTNGPIFGFRLNNNILRVIGLEHTLAFSTDYLTPKAVLNPQNARGFVYNTNLLVNIPVKKFIPYGTIGVGIIHQFGYPDSPIGTKLALNYGGGVKFARLLGPLGLRFDMRGYRAMRLLFVSSKGGLNIFEGSAGLFLSWGH